MRPRARGVSAGLAATSTVSSGLSGATSASSASAAPRSTSLHRDGGLIVAARAHAARSSPTRHPSGTSISADHPCLSVRTVTRIGGPPRAEDSEGSSRAGRVEAGSRACRGATSYGYRQDGEFAGRPTTRTFRGPLYLQRDTRARRTGREPLFVRTLPPPPFPTVMASTTVVDLTVYPVKPARASPSRRRRSPRRGCVSTDRGWWWRRERRARRGRGDGNGAESPSRACSSRSGSTRA